MTNLTYYCAKIDELTFGGAGTTLPSFNMDTHTLYTKEFKPYKAMKCLTLTQIPFRLFMVLQ